MNLFIVVNAYIFPLTVRVCRIMNRFEERRTLFFNALDVLGLVKQKALREYFREIHRIKANEVLQVDTYGFMIEIPRPVRQHWWGNITDTDKTIY